MPSIAIPGFGFGAQLPDEATLTSLLHLGVFSGGIRAFASEGDFAKQGQFTTPAAKIGRAKYWNVPYANRPTKYVFLKRDESGAYIGRPMARNAQTHPIHLNLFSLSALSFYDSRPSIQVPELELRDIDFNEAGRLAFPDWEVEDPIDYPIAAVWSESLPNTMTHTFPSSCVLFLRNGRPFIATITDAMAEFPVTWPRPVEGTPAPVSTSTVDEAAVVAAMAALVAKPAARVQAVPILQGPGSAKEKLAALLIAAR